MKTLLESVKDYFASLQTGDRLKYISGNNTVDILSVEDGGTSLRFTRGSDTTSSGERTLSLSALEEVIAALENGDLIHIETFFRSGGNNRSVYETLLAHSPRIAWCKVNNQKHLRAFKYEIHDPGELWRFDSDSWSNPEWAIATIVYLNTVRSKNRSTITAPLDRLLENTTDRKASSWQSRIANLKASEENGSFDGGENTKERATKWLQRAGRSFADVTKLAKWGFKCNANLAEVTEIGEILGVELEFEHNYDHKEESYQIVLKKCLHTKPFAILTGNSGTGKTHLAEALAATYRNHDHIEKSTNFATVPVGADWTDSRAVVGFVNHLREGQLDGSKSARPIYQSTAVVDLLLSAKSDTDREIPHFLILDEMNLSHVERYFADFLSAMESQEGRLRLHDEGPRDEVTFRLPRFDGDPVGVPRTLVYPENLFVIGTVNIDETTYMFSPKVLDRAHVIEFIVNRDDIAEYLKNPVDQIQVTRAGDAKGRAFLELSRNTRRGVLETLPKDVSEKVNEHLMDCLDLLQKARLEFAYRTVKEIERYMRVCYHLAEDKDEWKSSHRPTPDQLRIGHSNWLSDLDDEILQKILPKLHGSRNRIGSLIGALTNYMHSGDVQSAEAFFTEGGAEIAEKSISDPDFAELKVEDARFPRSFQKLKAMAAILVEEQFVSFIC